MRGTPPLGEREGLTLELKRRDTLTKPARIVREAVAMLNSGAGGEVWIGIAEEDERGVSVESIPDVESQRRRLEDACVESIEPSPLPDEVDVESVVHAGSSLIVVRVREQAPRRPYAMLEGGGRKFLIRVGARVRLMDRSELQTAFQEGNRSEGDAARTEEARGAVQARRDEIARQGSRMWLVLRPSIDQRLELAREQVARMADPTSTGNRRDGWTYGGAFVDVRLFQHGWRLKADRAGLGDLLTEIHSDGTVDFLAPLGCLEHKNEREIHPWALLEYCTSVLRLARAVHVLNPSPEACPCMLGFGLFGICGWSLRKGSPGSIFFDLNRPGSSPRVFEDGHDLTLAMDVAWDDLTAQDDRVALQLVRRIYRAFGYEPSAIPPEFDQERVRLSIGD